MISHKSLYLAVQSAFWCLLFLFSIYYFGYEEQRYTEAIILTSLYLPVVALTAYFIVHYLIPKYLLKGKVWYFYLYLLYTFIASVYAAIMIIVSSLFWMAGYQYSHLLSPLQSLFTFIGFIYFFITLFVAISVTGQWQAMQRKYLLAMQEKSQAELKFLKTQLHPHFLFNTLNNLYYLTLQKSDKAPEVVMRLSHLLDYVLHRGKEPWVCLQEEWEKTEDFAYLESLRYEDRLQLHMQASSHLDQYKFPPLLMITLLENSFKHGVKETRGKATVQVSLQVEAAKILLRITNSKPQRDTSLPASGIGLPNIQKQLAYLYDDKYHLAFHDQPDTFTVTLILPAYAYH